jgi:hypothetical protein
MLCNIGPSLFLWKKKLCQTFPFWSGIQKSFYGLLKITLKLALPNHESALNVFGLLPAVKVTPLVILNLR